jgi:hypothetical protein
MFKKISSPTYTALSTDSVLECSCVSAIAITLYSTAQLENKELTIRKTDSSANAITITPASGQTIGDSSTYTVSSPNQYVTLITYAGGWRIKDGGDSDFATTDGVQTFTNKTLTSPKVGTAITDTNGNEIIKTPATASAVNEITVTNAATGNAPSISATGDNTNIDLELTPKGTGTVTVNGVSILDAEYDTEATVTQEITSLASTVHEGQLTAELSGNSVVNILPDDVAGCEDATNFTGTNATLADDTTNKISGTNAMKITLTDVAGTADRYTSIRVRRKGPHT